MSVGVELQCATAVLLTIICQIMEFELGHGNHTPVQKSNPGLFSCVFIISWRKLFLLSVVGDKRAQYNVGLKFVTIFVCIQSDFVELQIYLFSKLSWTN